MTTHWIEATIKINVPIELPDDCTKEDLERLIDVGSRCFGGEVFGYIAKLSEYEDKHGVCVSCYRTEIETADEVKEHELEMYEDLKNEQP